jgi:hypothetical protein
MQAVQYSIAMPNQLNFSQKLSYGIDLVIRDIGYFPIIGAFVGIPRIVIGIFQKVIGGEGSFSWNEGDGIIKFTGSRLAADGEANIIRGIFETCCIGFILVGYDLLKDDRWILFPGWRN